MNGQSYLYTGPDGVQYHVYTQTNLVTTATTYDDSAFTYFGTWNTYGPDSALYGGSDHWSDDPAASYGFLFSGTGVTVYVQTAPWFGIASYAVDGGMGTDFDAYSPARANQVVAFRSGPLAPGTHRLIVRNTGRKNPANTNAFVRLETDRADIGNGAIIPPLAP